MFCNILIFILVSYLAEISARNQACELIVLVDDSVEKLFKGDQVAIQEKVSLYVDKLNYIYKSTILADPPNDNIFFKIS